MRADEGHLIFLAGSIRSLTKGQAGVVEWLMAPGCKPGERKLYVGSNPTPCTIEILRSQFEISKVGRV